jgi:hypothetical protein
MKLQMKREALEKINRQAPASQRGEGFCYGAGTMNWVLLRCETENELLGGWTIEK